MLFSDVVEVVLPTPLHLLVLLAVASAWTWARVGAARAAPGPRGRRARGARAARAAAIAATAWAAACLTPAFADRLVVALEGDPAAAEAHGDTIDPRHRIVVLGSAELRTPAGRTRVRLTREGWERVHGAVELWRRIGGVLVFTGGPDGDADASIAGHGARLARELGVPPASIVVSAAGATTRGELVAVASLPGLRDAPVWLVTSALHMRRARLEARRAGLSVRPHPVGFLQIRDHGWWSWVPSNAALGRLSLALHEWAGIAVHVLRSR